MFTRFAISSALLVSSAIAQVASNAPVRDGQQWVRVTTGTIPDTGKGALRVIAPGAVVVRGVPGSQITYSLQARADVPVATLAAMVHWRRQGGILTLTVAGANQVRYELQLKVPRQFGPVGVEALTGDVSVYDLDTPLQVRAGGGKLQADRVASVEAESWGGEVRLGQINGTLRVRAGGGNLTLERGYGETWLETGGGDIFVRRVDGALHAATGAGNIQAELVGELAELRTAGGRIEVGQANGIVLAESQGGVIAIGRAPEAQCVSAGGAIRLREPSTVQAVTAIGSITADLPAQHPFHGGILRTGHGDVIVSIPSKLSVTVVARSAAAGKKGSIVSEFPGLHLEWHGPAENAWSIGQIKVNGGGPVLQIETSQGAIYLRRQ